MFAEVSVVRILPAVRSCIGEDIPITDLLPGVFKCSTMTSVMAAMLDELMGRHRNAMPHERPKDPVFSDEEVQCYECLAITCSQLHCWCVSFRPASFFWPDSVPISCSRTQKRIWVRKFDFSALIHIFEMARFLGICEKLHDERLKEQYQSDPRFETLGYEDQFLSFLQKIHGDMERKIAKNKARLELTQPGGEVADSNKSRLQEKMTMLSDKISSLIAEVMPCPE